MKCIVPILTVAVLPYFFPGDSAPSGEKKQLKAPSAQASTAMFQLEAPLGIKPYEILKGNPPGPSEKVILVLQTRQHRITILSSRDAVLYSVDTESGVQLAEKLTASELKARFPELHDVATGVAWAGF